MTFGERLRVARSNARMSQADLTRLCGVPKTMLSRYENDHILPSIGTLRKLALALNISEAGLLGDRRDLAESFEGALSARGVSMETVDDATRLADVIADMVDASDTRVDFLTEEERARHA